MDNHKEILKRLHAIPDKEWLDVVEELTTFVHFKLKGKTIFGAHSENVLGVEPIDYYVDGAISKLFGLEWEWKYEKYSLLEQLKRIIGSMISTNVESYKRQKIKELPTEDEIIDVIIEKNNTGNGDDNEIYEIFKKALEECSKDDDDLQLYIMALDECNSFNEMSSELDWDKKKLYSLQQKLTRRVIKYLETNKELVR